MENNFDISDFYYNSQHSHDAIYLNHMFVKYTRPALSMYSISVQTRCG